MRAYRFKLYNNKRKNKELSDITDRMGRLYNYCIRLHKLHWEWYHTYLNRFALLRFLTKLKRRKSHEWMRGLPSCAVNNLTTRIDRGFKKYFSNKRKKTRIAPPTFKKIKSYKSYTLAGSGYKLLDGNRIRLKKTIFRYHKSQEILGDVKTVTIKRDKLGCFWLIISTDYMRSERKSLSGKIVGFDFGMKHMLVGSDKSVVDFPLFLKSQFEEFKRRSRQLSRKKKGSNNRNRARVELVRFHRRIKNKREDYQWKLARKLLSEYDVICLEDLNVLAMFRQYGRKLADYGFSSLVQKLQYLAMVFRKRVVLVNRFYPSSKTCSNCGYINKELKLKDRKWCCPSCGMELDRDYNASVNILREGASSLGVDSVSPALLGNYC